jgi:CRISPR-associated endonuclease/helicase Cas3
MRQSFMTAAKAFRVIDTGTQGIIVPYSSAGRDAINALCAAHDPSTQFRLLKNAQRFTVNVFPHVLERLQRARALHEVQEGTGILYLEDKYYSDDFGLNEAGTEAMETQFA